MNQHIREFMINSKSFNYLESLKLTEVSLKQLAMRGQAEVILFYKLRSLLKMRELLMHLIMVQGNNKKLQQCL
jgi:hypothetical protein